LIAFKVMAISTFASVGVAVKCGIEAFAVLLKALALLAVAAPGFCGRRHCVDAVGQSCPNSCSSGTSLLGTECIGIALQYRHNDLGSLTDTFDAVLIVVTFDTAAHVGTLDSIGEALG